MESLRLWPLWPASVLVFVSSLLPPLLSDMASTSGKRANLLAPVDLSGDPLSDGAISRLGTVRFRFKGKLNSITYAPCGKMLASGGKDGTGALIRLWDVANGMEASRLRVAGSEVNAVAFSPDGRTLVSCTENEKIQLWDVVGNEFRLRFALPALNPWAVAFSPDGKVLASAGKTIQFWDPVTCKPIREMRGRGDDIVISLAFSADGKFLASGSRDGHIRLWLVKSGKELLRLTHPGAPGFLPPGAIRGHPNGATLPPFPHLAFSPDGQMLACGGGKCFVLWEATTGKEVLLVKRKRVPIEMVAFSPDGRTLASAGGDKAIRLWNVRSGRLLREFVGCPGFVNSIAYAPDGKTLASGSWGGTICLWDVESGRQRPLPAGHQDSVLAMAISPNGKLLASGSADCTVRLWDLDTSAQKWRLPGHQGSVESVAFSPDGRILASGSQDKTIYLWDVGIGQQLRHLAPHEGAVGVVAFSPDGKILASGSRDRTIRLWDVQTGKELVRIQGQGDPAWVRSLAFSPDGRVLASGGCDAVIYLWNVASGKRLREFRGLEDQDVIYSLAFSPDRKSLASACANGKLCLWDMRAGKEVRQFKGHKHAITRVVFSPDGKMLASIGEDCTIRLWEVATGGEAREIAWTNGYVRALAFSPDGKTLACGGDGDFSILVWDLTGLRRQEHLPAVDLSPEKAESLWHDLVSLETGRAYEAIWKLVAGRRQTVAFLEKKLAPIQPVPATRLKRLMQDLDNPQFAVRRKAARELEGLRDLAEPFLVEALANPPSVEVQKEAEALLQKLGPTNPDRLRIARATSALEYLATAEARALLEKLAQGSPDAWLTQEARASLKRLAKLSAAAQR